MPLEDIRAHKKELRKQYRQLRLDMASEAKARDDAGILRRVRSLFQYRNAKTLLTYISLDIEVDTLQLVRAAWADGKTVAVPRCIDGTTEMQFYIITSEDQLTPRTFGVLEPDPERCPLLTDCSNSICVVPGLAFDYAGYRLGYGKGYYDRFLSGYSEFKVGLVYASCVTHRLVHGRFDVPVDLVVTEKYVRRSKPQRPSRPSRTARASRGVHKNKRP